MFVAAPSAVCHPRGVQCPAGPPWPLTSLCKRGRSFLLRLVILICCPAAISCLEEEKEKMELCFPAEAPSAARCGNNMCQFIMRSPSSSSSSSSSEPRSSERIIFFDFSTAFNTIQPADSWGTSWSSQMDHPPTPWILDYLTNRSQYVRTRDYMSDTGTSYLIRTQMDRRLLNPDPLPPPAGPPSTPPPPPDWVNTWNLLLWCHFLWTPLSLTSVRRLREKETSCF